MLAVVNGNIGIATILLEEGCLVDRPNKYAFTALHAACEQKAKELIQLLLAHG